MTAPLHTTAAPPDQQQLDLERWPSLAPPRSAPLRAAIARLVLRRVATRAGIRINLPDGRRLGPTHGPEMDLNNPEAFFTRLGRTGKIGFGESYMAGEWTSGQLVGVLEAMADNVATLVPPRAQWLRRWYEPRPPAVEDNDRDGARRNIARHYDLSNDFFASFLDQTMTYSSALFTGSSAVSGSSASLPDHATTLEEAQGRKIERLLDAAGVKAGTALLEIGTGWGELAMRAALRGARVTSLTLSEEQAALARRRVEAAGLAGAVDVRVQDYRDVTGRFDAIVSVEMIEAVGERWWPTYFRVLDEHLAPGGRVGLQTILMAHDRLLATRSSWTWIRKYIFPGGLIPSEEAINQELEPRTSLRISSRMTFGASYATTLQRWRTRFGQQAELVDQLGFDETFRRMWTFYLAYSEAGFRSGYLDVAQLVLTKDHLAR